MKGHLARPQACRLLFLALLLGVIASVALGDTVAYWRFDDMHDSEIVENAGGSVADGVGLPDSDGQTVWRKAVHDYSGNGNHLTTWEYSWAGHDWSSAVGSTIVPSLGLDNALCITSAGSYPAMMTWSEESNPTGVDLETWSPSAFTIEASFNLTDISGYHTIVGRDGSEVATDRGETSLAPFYLSSRYANGTLGVVMTDVDGYTHIVESEEGFIETGTWYNVVVVSDGETLSLYCNNELVDSNDMTASGSTDTRLAVGSTSGDGWESGTWTVTRGLYGGSHTDRVYGSVDEIRFSDEALDPTAFLFGKASAKANSPFPANGELDAPAYVTLSWGLGAYDATHNVYFGSSEEDLAELATGLDVNSYEIGQLELGETYYWRVDEVNVTSDHTVTTGNLWSFQVEPVSFEVTDVNATASSYDGDSLASTTVDANGLDSDDLHGQNANDMWVSASGDTEPWILYDFNEVRVLDEMWVWNSNMANETFLGFGIKSAKIEASIDGEEWTVFDDDLILTQASGMGSTAVTDVVDMGTLAARYVRITAQSNWTMVGMTQYSLSQVRFYAIPTKARLPEPADEATDVAVTKTLSWRAGRYAVSHDVYFSMDEEAVADGTAYVGSVDDAEFATGDLDLSYAQTYYWRVDEVNDEEVFTGDVWSFSTPDYILVDDMESYNTSSNFIYDTWLDGFDDSTNASQVGHDDSPYYEESIVHGGSQSMPLYYNYTDGDGSTTSFDLGGVDWSLGGLKTLTLYVLGDRDNADGQLYLELDGARVTWDASLSQGLWKQWDIDLSMVDTDLSDIDELVIGVEADSTGLVYIDDITVHADEVAEEILPVVPGTDALELWYEMEGDLTDSANSYDGDSNGTYTMFTDGLLGQALEFDGADTYVEMPIGSLVSGLTSSTFSIWVYMTDGDASWQRAFDIGTGTDNYLFMCPRISTAGVARVAIISQDSDAETLISSEVAVPTEYWVNLTVVFDAEAGTMEFYVGGVSVGSVETTDFPANLGETTQNWLGDSQYDGDGLFEGIMDDFRIYSEALSAAEVLSLAGGE